MSARTPGNWERRDDKIGVVVKRKTGTGVEQRRFDVVAFTRSVTHTRDYRGWDAIKAEQDANGDLIAAAPYLAAALKACVAAMRLGDCHGPKLGTIEPCPAIHGSRDDCACEIAWARSVLAMAGEA